MMQLDLRDFLKFPWLCDNAQFLGQTADAYEG